MEVRCKWDGEVVELGFEALVGHVRFLSTIMVFFVNSGIRVFVCGLPRIIRFCLALGNI